MDFAHMAREGTPPRQSHTADWVLIADDVARRFTLPSLPDLVEIALGHGGTVTRTRSAREALAILAEISPRPEPRSPRLSLEATLERVLAAAPNPNYRHWTERAADLRHKGIGFATICPPGGAPWLILSWLDRGLCGGHGKGRSDPLKGQHDGLPVCPDRLAYRSRRKGSTGASIRSVEAWRPILERVGAIELVRREARGRKVYAPAWLGADDPRPILEAVLQELVEMHLAGTLPRGRSGSPNPVAVQGAESEAVRTSCGSGAVLNPAQPAEAEAGYSEINRDTDTDTTKSAFKGGPTTRTVEGGTRGKGSSDGISGGKKASGRGGGSGVPPGQAFPAYVEMMIENLGESARPTLEGLALRLFQDHGGDAVEPFFRDASRQTWDHTLAAVDWIVKQVRGAVDRGELPEISVRPPGAREGVA